MQSTSDISAASFGQIAQGICAANHSYPVFFDTATGWITRLLTAHNTGTLDKELRRLRRYRALITDEVGYIPFEDEAANLFFQLIANRYEHGTVIVASNLAFSQWGHTLGDDVIAAATIDRLIHHAHVLTMDGGPYRTRRYTTPLHHRRGVRFHPAIRGQYSLGVDSREGVAGGPGR